MWGGKLNKRTFLKASAAALWSARARAQGRPPNFVFIYADDLGYGDLGCYGSRIATPNLDSMAAEGMRFTNFYSASPVCSPSRASLLTGRYPARTGVTGVLMAEDKLGLSLSEVTLAQVLHDANYRTMCIGKWHLGRDEAYLPTSRGFDEYFGIPYSNDMWPLPLMRNTTVVEQPCNLNTLMQRYTDEAAGFIGRSATSAFFLYLAYPTPHIPLASSENFRGRSGLGPYGDAVQEMDWSVGRVLQALIDNGADQNTLVMFSSDNGPWYQGSPGPLRGRKGETWEGGVREPFIARFPGAIQAGAVCNGVASTMDVMPTLAALAGAQLPARRIDGMEIWPLLSSQTDQLDREALLYFNGWHIQCARLGRWKLHISRYNSFPWTPDPPGGRFNLPLPRPELYDMDADPAEGYDLAWQNPDVVADIRSRIESALPGFPDEVRNAWRDTFNTAVEDTPAGALPIRKAS